MQYPFHCPHCLSEKVAFDYIGHKKVEDFAYDSSAYTTFWACVNCHKGLCAKLLVHSGGTPQKIQDTAKYNFTVLETYPAPKPPQAPEHTPGNIAKIYIQGLNSFVRKELDAAAVMMRKTLEMSVKTFIPEPDRLNLALRIEKLKDSERIPRDMITWAREIKEIGNEGAHGVVTQEDADDIVFFTEMFLTYIYTLPTKIAERRKSKTD